MYILRQVNKEDLILFWRTCLRVVPKVLTDRGREILKDIERKLLSELLKNSRRSDRELAKAIGASQPTTTRLRTKLEKEGHIKEYTIIPRFSKIGYHIMAFSFLKVASPVTEETLERFKKILPEKLADNPFGIVLAKSCMGSTYDAVIVSFHPNYAFFDDFRLALKHNVYLNVVDLIVFLVNLDEESMFLPLTFSLLSNELLTLEEKMLKSNHPFSVET
jgi:DNA-binding Lrp family transcriptional regulator